MKSIAYWHPLIYSSLIKFSYGKYYKERYKAISNLIEDNSSVVDICCGDCKIFTFLKDKKIDYLGLDFNNYFVKNARKRGIKAAAFDVCKDEIPKSEYILMQGSLYHFFPRQNEILQKMLDAASKFLIISEPVKNKVHSKSKVISFLGRILNNPGDGVKKFKFDMNTFTETLRPFQKSVKKMFLVANGIDCIAIMKKDK